VTALRPNPPACPPPPRRCTARLSRPSQTSHVANVRLDLRFVGVIFLHVFSCGDDRIAESVDRKVDYTQVVDRPREKSAHHVEIGFLSLGKWGRKAAARTRSVVRSGRIRVKRVISAASRPTV
jgi:hypothetical protein